MLSIVNLAVINLHNSVSLNDKVSELTGLFKKYILKIIDWCVVEIEIIKSRSARLYLPSDCLLLR